MREGRPQALTTEEHDALPPRPVDSTLHGVVAYSAGATLLTAFPRWAVIEGTRSARQVRTAAAVHAAYSTLTDYPLGVVKVLPFRRQAGDGLRQGMLMGQRAAAARSR